MNGKARAMERMCKDCKHYHRRKREMWTDPESCHALDGKPNPVTGDPIDGIEPSTMRLTLCGFSDPKLWEQKVASIMGGGK